MKTKKELLQEFLDAARENIIKIDIRSAYIQNEYATENKQADAHELAQLTTNKKESEKWATFLEEEIKKEK